MPRVTRREFVRWTIASGAGLAVTDASGWSQTAMATTRFVDTPALRIGYEETGPADGLPVVLLHGFPDDVHAYDGVAPPLAAAGLRVLVPYLRGFGPTRFRDPSTPRTAEQAAIGQDVIDFAEALRLPAFAVAGYDWGGRAAAIAAAIHPDRVRAALLIGGYTIQNTLVAAPPGPPEAEYRAWYQWYFNTERGRAGLQANRRSLCRLLWQLWSPTWRFTDAEYNRTAEAFENPDFVDVVIHSYRHRNANAPGDPQFAEMEARLARRPRIETPTMLLFGADDGVAPPPRDGSAAERALFTTLVDRRVVAGVGHFMPRERPDIVSSALLDLLRRRP